MNASSATPDVKVHRDRLRAGGRIVDTWRIPNPFIKEPAIKVDVSLLQKQDGSFTFSASNELFGTVEMEDADLNVLWAKVNQLAGEHLMKKYSAVWEDWLEVQTDGDAKSYRARKGSGTFSLSLTYAPIQRGTLANGEIVTLNNNGLVIPFPASKRVNRDVEGKVISRAEGLRIHDVHEGVEVSYVPATAENIAALDAIIERMKILHEKMADFLQQDQVVQSLSNLPALQALPFANLYETLNT